MRRVLLLAICIVTLAANAAAQYSVFEEAVTADFSKEEMEMFKGTITETLNSTETNTTKEWKSSKSDAGGSVTVSEVFTKSVKGEELPCRKTKMINHARGQTGKQVHTFCKIKDGSWKIFP